MGVFTWQDGSTYEGFWLNGRKDGVGVFRPAPHTQGMPGSDPSVRHLAERQPAGVSDGASPPHSPVVQAASPDLPLDSPAAAGRAVRQLTSLPQGERLGVWGAVGQLIACPNVIAARVRQHRCKARVALLARFAGVHTAVSLPCADDRRSIGAGASSAGGGLVYVCQ